LSQFSGPEGPLPLGLEQSGRISALSFCRSTATSLPAAAPRLNGAPTATLAVAGKIREIINLAW
jgi:hypothetical protein